VQLPVAPPGAARGDAPHRPPLLVAGSASHAARVSATGGCPTSSPRTPMPARCRRSRTAQRPPERPLRLRVAHVRVLLGAEGR
jgi:hypothetical protein